MIPALNNPGAPATLGDIVAFSSQIIKTLETAGFQKAAALHTEVLTSYVTTKNEEEPQTQASHVVTPQVTMGSYTILDGVHLPYNCECRLKNSNDRWVIENEAGTFFWDPFKKGWSDKAMHLCLSSCYTAKDCFNLGIPLSPPPDYVNNQISALQKQIAKLEKELSDKHEIIDAQENQLKALEPVVDLTEKWCAKIDEIIASGQPRNLSKEATDLRDAFRIYEKEV